MSKVKSFNMTGSDNTPYILLSEQERSDGDIVWDEELEFPIPAEDLDDIKSMMYTHFRSYLENALVMLDAILFADNKVDTVLKLKEESMCVYDYMPLSASYTIDLITSDKNSFIINVQSPFYINTMIQDNSSMAAHLNKIKEQITVLIEADRNSVLEAFGYKFVSAYNPNSTFKFVPIEVKGVTFNEDDVDALVSTILETASTDWLTYYNVDRSNLNGYYETVSEVVQKGGTILMSCTKRTDDQLLKLNYETLLIGITLYAHKYADTSHALKSSFGINDYIANEIAKLALCR